MKTKNLSLKILSVVALILCLGLFLTACDEQSTTTISLAEGKEIIVNALQLDSVSVSAYSEEDNRDVFLKFKNTEFDFESVSELHGETSNIKISGIANKSKTGWEKYVLENIMESKNETNPKNNYLTSVKEYYDGSFVYGIGADGSKTKTEFANSPDSLIGNLSTVLLSFDMMFMDKAFETAYQNEVLKTKTENSYTLTIQVNMYEYASFVMEVAGENADGLFGSGETIEALKEIEPGQLVVGFDNDNEIKSVNFDLISFGMNMGSGELLPSTSTLSLTKFESEITAPSWFNSQDFNI